MAERVGVPERDFGKANEYNGFALITRNRNDLAPSNSRQRLRPFAGFCRFFWCNGTRNGTRRGKPGGCLGRHSCANLIAAIGLSGRTFRSTMT